jgi:hypothetical protein
MRARRALAVAALSLALCGFRIESAVTEGCHEKITERAMRRLLCDVDPETCAGNMDAWFAYQPIAPPDARTRNILVALRGDLPFRGWQTELAWYSLITGVRYNDLHGNGAIQLNDLRVVHGVDEGQEEHCLRRVEDDGEEGNVRALEACHAFILTELARAVGAFRAPEDQRLIPVTVFFDNYGHVQVQLWSGFFYLGRALHALQDAFPHTLRNGEMSEIFAIANYSEPTLGSYDEARDGPAHNSHLDQCGVGESGEALAVEATIQSEAVLRALMRWLTADEDVPTRQALDSALRYRSGCTVENDYCDSPFVEHAKTCSAAGGAPLAWAIVTIVILRRAARRRSEVSSASPHPH